MENLVLKAEPRVVTGKQVRFLRRKGILPANVYGHNITSVPVQVDARAFTQILARAGHNRLIRLEIAGSKEPRSVLIADVQRSAIGNALLHADLRQVSMTETLRVEVPLVFTGEAPGVANFGGTLLRNLDTIEIECLPADLIANIEVDLSSLLEIDSAILVKDLKVGPKIKVLTPGDELVVKVLPPEAEEVVEEEAAAPTEVEVVSKTGKAEEEAAAG